MKDILNLDLETFSTEDIKNGSYKYAEGMIILLLAYSFNYEPVQLIDFTIWQDMEMTPEEIWEELPDRLRDAFLNPNVIKKSANVNFERTQLGKYFNIYIPPEQCQCTLVHAGMAGYPMNLDMCAKALKLEQLKSSVGKALIRIFCIPNKDGSRNYPYQFPEKWLQFGAYCIQDVVVEQEIEKAISWYIITPLEHQIWCMGERKNERGVRIDRELIDSAIYLDNIYHTNLVKEALELTGLSNPNSPKQLKDWLKTELEQEDDIKSLDKNAVSKMLREVDDEKVLRVLTIRKQLAKSSITKYAAMERQASSVDDRIRGMFQYYGAQKSGRECLAEDTMVLVKNYIGIYEKPIQEVLLSDQVFDGNNWVWHEGVVFSGDKEIITHDNICATGEHVVYLNDTLSLPLKEVKEKNLKIWRGNIQFIK
jgi:DNA polymerase